MKLLKNIFNFDKQKAKKEAESDLEEPDEYNLGEFNINELPEEHKNKSIYFSRYNKPDGKWVYIGETICEFLIEELDGGSIQYESIVKASKAGYLEWTIKDGELLTNGKAFYKLHQEVECQNENSVENSEYKEYFKDNDYEHLFIKWLVVDGSYIKTGEPIFQYSDYNSKKYINYSKKSGFIHQICNKDFDKLDVNELMYFVRDTDKQRIEQLFNNIPDIIIDEFSDTTTIKWYRVSSEFESCGIKTKSDDLITDFLFSFNYIDNRDYIIFHFDPKQIRPKQFDKVSFLFENGEQIQFELATNPILIKNGMSENILEYKGLITKTELELFSSINFKKWKISLLRDNRNILGGEISEDEVYSTKYNLQIVIKKFANDYIDIVRKTIPNYKPTELKETELIKKTTNEICFVYLMYDTSNAYYKIGISNNPEYRERTLQSEKPTIELIKSKKFPIRKIAESIEKALHNAYSEKRIRGEWFKLDQNDVEHIKQTLS